MPFTPLHMGPGLLFKALLQGGFSLLIFGWTQVLLDIQPLLVLLSGQGELHGITHSYLGALSLALIATPTGKYIFDYGLTRVYKGSRHTPGWAVVFSSALLGAFSHILLDSLMHGDMSPLAPFSYGNSLSRFIAYDSLNLFCIASGLLGLTLWALISRSKRKVR